MNLVVLAADGALLAWMGGLRDLAKPLARAYAKQRGETVRVLWRETGERFFTARRPRAGS